VFKIGDMVNIHSGDYKGHKGIIISSKDTDNSHVVSIKTIPKDGIIGSTWRKYYIESYELEVHDICDLFSYCHWVNVIFMEPFSIPDTKLGRKLYKNKIKEIKNGRIYL
jgi:ribosomal protein L24